MKRLTWAGLLVSTSLWAADREAVYQKEIVPLLEKSCIDCHGRDGKKPKGGFNATTLAGLEKGGKEEGPGITWGNAEKSSLYLLAQLGATNRADEMAMPPKDKKQPALTEAQLAKLKGWIEAK